MISTPMSCTSDYYSGSDIEYDNDDVVKAAPQHFLSTKETNSIFQTLLQYHHSSSFLNSNSKLQQQSIRLTQLARKYCLSNEIIIRANFILHHLLLRICTNEIDESIITACLSLSTKFTEHSTHANITLFNSDTLISNETFICDRLDWDIDIITPIHYVESILLHIFNDSKKDRLRQLTYELIVLCLIDLDIGTMGFSAFTLGINCLLVACELIDCCDVIPKEIFQYEQENNVFREMSFNLIRQTLMNILCL